MDRSNYEGLAAEVKGKLDSLMYDREDKALWFITTAIESLKHHIDDKNSERLINEFSNLMVYWSLIVPFNLQNGLILTELHIDGLEELIETF